MEKKSTLSVPIYWLIAALDYLFWGAGLFFAYQWFSWNFNLPVMTYWQAVAIFGTFDGVIRTIKKIFQRGA